MKSRLIHPEIFTSKSFISLSLEARLLWIGMFSRVADDEGRGKADEITLKCEVFPADTYALNEIGRWRDEVSGVGMIELYGTEDALYFHIPRWRIWQQIKYVKSSKLPSINDFPNLPQFGPKLSPVEKSSVVKCREEKCTTGAPAPAAAKKPPRKPTPFSICLEHFKRGHQKTLELPYDETEYKRDNKLLSPKIQTYGVPTVRECMDAFWSEQRKQQRQQETWIGKGAPTIPGFCRVFPLIIQKYKPEGEYDAR